MEVTTVKIYKNTKSALDEIKGSNQTYDDIIGKLISENKGKDLKKKLIEFYKKEAYNQMDLFNEWENASREVDDE